MIIPTGPTHPSGPLGGILRTSGDNIAQRSPPDSSVTLTSRFVTEGVDEAVAGILRVKAAWRELELQALQTSDQMERLRSLLETMGKLRMDEQARPVQAEG